MPSPQPPSSADRSKPASQASAGHSAEPALLAPQDPLTSLEPSNLLDPRSPLPAGTLPRPANLRALTSVRFFAALHVSLYHFAHPFVLWGFLAAFMEAGYIGVSFFFILSGFILTYSQARDYAQGTASTPRFFFNRFARIYPVYLLFLLPGISVTAFNRHTPTHWVGLFACLTMIQSWSVHTAFYFNVPAWTLSCEAFFYLLFPFLVLRLRPRSVQHGLLLLGAFWLLAMVAPTLNLLSAPDQTWHQALWYGPDPGRFTLLIIRNPLLALPEFLAGIVTGWLLLDFAPSRATAARLLAVGLPTLLLALLFSNHLPAVFLHDGLLIPVFAAILLGLSQPNLLTRLLSVSFLVLLGEASYVYYLSHELLDGWLKPFLPAHTDTSRSLIPHALLESAVVAAIAILLHFAVEEPCRRLLLRWYKRRFPAAPRLIPT